MNRSFIIDLPACSFTVDINTNEVTGMHEVIRDSIYDHPFIVKNEYCTIEPYHSMLWSIVGREFLRCKFLLSDYKDEELIRRIFVDRLNAPIANFVDFCEKNPAPDVIEKSYDLQNEYQFVTYYSNKKPRAIHISALPYFYQKRATRNLANSFVTDYFPNELALNLGKYPQWKDALEVIPDYFDLDSLAGITKIPLTTANYNRIKWTHKKILKQKITYDDVINNLTSFSFDESFIKRYKNNFTQEQWETITVLRSMSD